MESTTDANEVDFGDTPYEFYSDWKSKNWIELPEQETGPKSIFVSQSNTKEATMGITFGTISSRTFRTEFALQLKIFKKEAKTWMHW